MSAILGVMFASLVGLLMIPAYMHFETVAIDNAKAATTAQQMQQVSQAAQAYIQANYSAVEANSTASNPATITVSMLQNTGYLPNAFSAANPFGQMWQVQVLQPTPGQLQALVLTQGGTQIGQVQAPMIAAQAGAQGGFVPYNGQYGTLNDTVAQGAYSGWQVSMSGYTDPGPGHLAALLAFNNGNLENNYLYRVAVPGQPQLNTMQTNLNMGTNSVNNANEVNAQSETLASGEPNGQPGSLQIGSNYYYGDGTNAAVRTPGSFYIQNQNGSGAAQIAEVSNVWGSGELQGGYINSTGDVNAQYNSTATNAFAMDDGAWWANSGGNSSQSGSIWASGNINTPGFYADNNGYSGTNDTFTANSRIILGTAFGNANVGWGCGPNGEIAANANGSGQILSCQGGSWQAMGGGGLGITQLVYQSPVFNNVGNVGLGWFRYCAVNYNQSNAALYPGSYGGNGYWYWYFNGAGNTYSQVSCYD
jgi:hypothetical protein